MTGKSEKVRVHFPDIDGHMGRALGAVHQDDRAFLMGQGNDLFHRIGHAHDIGHVADPNQFCPVRQFTFYLLIGNGAVRQAFQIDQTGLFLPGHHLPGEDVGMVLHNGNQDLIPFPDVGHAPGVGHQIDGFGSVSGEDDLTVLRRPDKGRRGMPGLFIAVGRFHAPGVEAPQRIGVAGIIERGHFREYPGRPLGGGRVVKIDLVIPFEDREVFTIGIHQQMPPLRNGKVFPAGPVPESGG